MRRLLLALWLCVGCAYLAVIVYALLLVTGMRMP